MYVKVRGLLGLFILIYISPYALYKRKDVQRQNNEKQIQNTESKPKQNTETRGAKGRDMVSMTCKVLLNPVGFSGVLWGSTGVLWTVEVMMS